MSNTAVSFPPFKGRVYKIGGPDYHENRYQYAFSSLPEGHMAPKFILYPADDEDVIKAINYAKATGVAIATRSGGHQYSGASSTNGENFQLDMSETYCHFEVEKSGLVRTGISFAIIDFLKEMKKHGFFVPTGQCRNVHLGGHVQTGGYGQLGRSYGLFGDHVQRIRIITDSEHGAVVRELSRHAKDPDEKNLFWAVMGGSPGNFGVLTHLWVKPLKDEDHEGSRGLKGFYWWSEERLKAVLDVMVDMQCDTEMPRNFDLCVSVVTNTALSLPYMFGKGIDEEISKSHPEFWGPDDQKVFPPAIVVYAQYVNIKDQPADHEVWFNKIKAALGDPIIPYSHKKMLDHNQTMKMSEMVPFWLFKNMREYLLPYEKRAFTTNWTTELKQSNWSTWVSSRINKVQKWHGSLGNYLAIQIQPFGGNKSMFKINGLTGETSYSWRDTTIVCVMDIFYTEPFLFHKPQQFALKWQETNDAEGINSGKNSKFCDKDRRLLWGSHGEKDMTKVADKYYELGKYDKLLAIKKKIDPRLIFSPNTFCVGGANPRTVVAMEHEPRPVVPFMYHQEAMYVNKQLERKKALLEVQQPKRAESCNRNIASINRDVARMAVQKSNTQFILQQMAPLRGSVEERDSMLPATPKITISSTPNSSLEVTLRNDVSRVSIGHVHISPTATLKELREKAKEEGVQVGDSATFAYHHCPITSKQEESWKVKHCAKVEDGKLVVAVSPMD